MRSSNNLKLNTDKIEIQLMALQPYLDEGLLLALDKLLFPLKL